MPYSAGIAFLQVVPSFRNFERQMRDNAAEIGREIDKSVSQALPKGMADGSRHARREGGKAGDQYGGAFASKTQQRIRNMVKAIPDVEIDADATPAERTLAKFRKRLQELHDQHVNLQIDDATVLQELRAIDRELSKIDRRRVSVEVHANTAAVRGEIAKIERDIDGATKTGRTNRRVDDKFTSDFRRAARTASNDLPETTQGLPPSVATEVRRIREGLRKLEKEAEIGLDLNDDEAIAKLERFRERLRRLHDRRNVEIRMEANTGAAIGRIDQLFETIHARRNRQNAEELAEQKKQQREAAKIQAERDRDHTRALAEQRTTEERAAERQRVLNERQAREVERRQERNRVEQRRRDERQAREDEKNRERDRGGFGRRFRETLGGAVDSSRKVVVDADTSQAQRKFQELRARMATLRDVDIGVDMDAGAAIVEIRAIEKELQKLARQTPDIQLRADIAEAYLKLRTIDRLADHLDGRRIDLNVDLDNAARGINNIGSASQASLSRLGALVAVIVGLGPALVPIAAGATVLLGSIATAAAGAAIGVGTVALAFFGIGDAVKALNEYQINAKKTAKALGQSENAVSNAVDGVTGSEQALQAARENAAYSAQRSAQAVVQARRAVTNAEKEAAKAQLDLADAIKAVQQQEQDRQLSLRDNELAQRKAIIDLKAAKADLDKLLRNPRATQDERELAKIAYQEQLLQIDQLSLAGKRLHEEQAEADRKGIKGADQVVAAQERIAGSQQSIADANLNLSNTLQDQRKQQTDSARAILSAQDSLEKSQRTLRQAYIATGAAGGDALQTLEQKMNALSPAGRNFAIFIFSLKDEFEQLRAATQTGFLPGAQVAIEKLLPFLPRLTAFLGDVAETMGQIAIRVATAFSNSGWQKFFSYIGQTAIPSLNGLATVTGNIIEGTRDLLIALSAFNKPIGKGLVDMTEAYARWAYQLKSSEGYKQFLAYVQSVGPDVIAFFENLVAATYDLLVAFAPVGKVVLGLVDALLRFIRVIPTNVLTLFVGLLTAFALRLLIVTGIQRTHTAMTNLSASAHNLYTRAARNASLAAVAFRDAQAAGLFTMAGFTSRLQAMSRNFTTLGGAARTVGRGLANFTSFLGGPWVVALIAATTVLTLMSNRADETKQNIDALRRFGEEFQRTGSLQSQSIKDMVKDNETLKKLIVNMESLAKAAGDFNTKLAETNKGNLSSDTLYVLQGRAALAYATDLNVLAKALTGNEEAQKQLDAVLKDVEENGNGADQKQEAKARREELNKLYGQQKLNAAVERELDKAARGTGEAFANSKPGLQDYVNSLKTLADASATAADKSDALRRADEALFGTQRNLQESIEAQARALRERNELLDDNNFLNKEGARQLNVSTEAGAKLTDVIEAELEAINATFRANVANNDSVEVATKKHDAEIAALRKKTQDKKLDQVATEHLIAVYGQVPTSKVTEFATVRFGATVAELDELMVYQLALREGISLETARGRLHPDIKSPGGKGNSRGALLAAGGPVIGPGDKTSDSVQAWIPKTRTPIALSDGEWVHRAAAVDYYGSGVMRAINEKRIPREMLGMMTGYATGGLVKQVREERYPFPYNTSTTKVPSRESVKAAVAKSRGYDSGPGGAGPGFLPWPSSPGAQRGDTGVWRSILSLVRSSGIPFNFGNAYRPGDPLWHGSGRAVDFMGYDQDELAEFFLKRQSQLLELIHLTGKSGYFVTRGQRKKNFAVQGPLHRNHLHVAMATGGLVTSPPQLSAASATYDQGGPLQPGYTLAYNGTGRTEQVLTSRQMADIQIMAKQSAAAGNAYHFQFRDTTLDASKLRAIQNREAALARVGRAR